MLKSIKKLGLIFILFIFCFLFCGCDNTKPYLTFNANPITQKTVYDAQKFFKPGQTIHYALFMPKGFDQEYLRIQIVKRAENIAQGGITIYMAKDLFIDTSKKFYIDRFVINQTGTFVVRFFYGNRVDKPFAENILWVKE